MKCKNFRRTYFHFSLSYLSIVMHFTSAYAVNPTIHFKMVCALNSQLLKREWRNKDKWFIFKHVFGISGTLVLLGPSAVWLVELPALEVIATLRRPFTCMKWSSQKPWLPQVPSGAGLSQPWWTSVQGKQDWGQAPSYGVEGGCHSRLQAGLTQDHAGTQMAVFLSSVK